MSSTTTSRDRPTGRPRVPGAVVATVGLAKSFGDIDAVRGVDLRVPERAGGSFAAPFPPGRLWSSSEGLTR